MDALTGRCTECGASRATCDPNPSQDTTWTLACGCIMVDAGEDGGRVDWCPTHAHAPAMRDALLRWHQFALDNGWTDEDFHDADGRGWITRDRAILRAVEG